MILTVDIGNSNVHLGLGDNERIVADADFPTAHVYGEAFLRGGISGTLTNFARGHQIVGAAMCSVVPQATPPVEAAINACFHCNPLHLTPDTIRRISIDYPEPNTIGQDRLANSIAAHALRGAPVVVVDFGTAVTFDIVDSGARYVGGIIAPGMSVMTDYMHEKTALLPRITFAEPDTVIGKSTTQAMQIGAVHGYRGLVRELIAELRTHFGRADLPVLATGGYAQLIASRVPEIDSVEPNLTLEGLRLLWLSHHP